MLHLILRWFANAVGLFVVAYIVPGITVQSWATLLIAALILGLLNAIVRPILVLLTLPLTILTLGIFLLVLNALMLELTDLIVPGFEIRAFWSALGGAVVLALVSLVTNRIGKDKSD